MKIGDWIHDSLVGVGQIVKFDDGTPMMECAGKPGWGLPCYHARLATQREIDAALDGKYFTDPEAK